jgi:hypothetical protein
MPLMTIDNWAILLMSLLSPSTKNVCFFCFSESVKQVASDMFYSSCHCCTRKNCRIKNSFFSRINLLHSLLQIFPYELTNRKRFAFSSQQVTQLADNVEKL